MQGDNEYLEFVIANTSMPVLLKYKPAALINFSKKAIKNKKIFLIELEMLLYEFTISFSLLYENNDYLYVFIYDKELLMKTIRMPEKQFALEKAGYDTKRERLEDYMKIIKQRFVSYQADRRKFPHEIGIFLGYPLEDVEGYILHQGKEYLLSGYWKVYHNVNQARKTFCFFKKLQSETVSFIKQGNNITDIKRTANDLRSLKDEEIWKVIN